LSCDGTFVAGAVADAAPVIAKETPAAPNAKAAFLRFRMELRLACVMVEPPRQDLDQWTRGSFRALRHEPARCPFGSTHPTRSFATSASVVMDCRNDVRECPAMKRALFVPTARQTNWLLVIGFLSLGQALYLRYMALENNTVSLACQAGLRTWLCDTFRLTIVLVTLAHAAEQRWRHRKVRAVIKMVA
jgi:hypothetical protein